jgi:hypothetical protein
MRSWIEKILKSMNALRMVESVSVHSTFLMTCSRARVGQYIEGKPVVVMIDDKDDESDEIMKKPSKEK